MRIRVFFLLFGLILALGSANAQNFPIAPYKEVSAGVDTKTNIVKAKLQFSSIEDFANGIFLRTDVDKVNLCENELVQVKWVLYYPNIPKLNAEYQITNYQIPNLPDFVKEWNIIAKDGDTSVVRGVIENGQPYRARTLLCFYMYPSKSGNVTVDGGTLTMQLYGSDGKEYASPLVLRSKPVSIYVKPLSSIPADFTGGIGEYTLQTELLNADSVHLGETATYRFKVKGSGNFIFVGAPKISFPDSVECYPVKPVNDIRYTCNECTGERVFDFLLIAHKVGDFIIPSTTLSYFDSRTRRFKTLKTVACKVSVLPALPKKEVEPVEVQEQPLKKDSFNKWLYVCAALFALISLLFIFSLIHKRRRIESRTDFELKAYDALTEAKNTLEGAAFYNKTVNVIITYIGDKLNYPVPTQSKTVLAEILKENGASEAAVSMVLSLIKECEKVCYSPEFETKQETVYETAVFTINQLQKDFDNTIRCNSIS